MFRFKEITFKNVDKNSSGCYSETSRFVKDASADYS